MFSNQVRQRVRGLVAGVGPSIISNPDQLEAKLADLAAASPEEVQAIVAAARGGVAEEIAAAAPEHRAEMVEQAAAWMASETGLPADLSRWAVETWNDALQGVQWTPQQPATVPAAPPLATAPAAAVGAPAWPQPAGAPPAPWDAPRAAQPSGPAPWGAPSQAQPWGPPQGGQWSNPGYGAPQAGAWPQPAQGVPGQPGAYWSNTSGLQGDVPPEIAKLKWNWGAFGLPFWWLRAHNLRMYSIAWAVVSVVLVRFVPGGVWLRLGLVAAISIALGLLGHKLAWQNRTFNDINHYLTVQRAWMAWGIPIAVISWGIGAIFLALYLVGLSVLAHAHP